MKSRKKSSKKINLKTDRFKLLFILLSFAFVGGGIMVYRSFAAVQNIWWSQLSDKSLSMSVAGAGCTSLGAPDGATKNPPIVPRLTCSKTSPNTGKASVIAKDIIIDQSLVNKTFIMCVAVKGIGIGDLYFGVPGNSRELKGIKLTEVSGGSFTTHCTEPVFVNRTGPAGGQFVITGTEYADATIQSMSLRLVDTPAPSGPPITK